MTLQELEIQFAYNEWANRLLLSAGGSLHPEDQNRNLGTSHRSVLGTLFHLVYSEWDWLHFWLGKSWEEIAREEPPESGFPNIALLQPQWVVIVNEQKTFLASLADEDLNQQISYKNLAGESCEFSLGETVQHLFNHSGYHRGQVVTLLAAAWQGSSGNRLPCFLARAASVQSPGYLTIRCSRQALVVCRLV